MKCFRGFRALIMGPPGCGKGHISQKIVKTYGAVHIAAGDILRVHMQKKTALGQRAVELISKGKLVPDHLLSNIITTAIYKAKGHNFILDGYPRNLSQAKSLSNVVKLDLVINLDIPPSAIMDKLQHRLVHVRSGRVYNEGAQAPLRAGRDDITGERLERRIDDDPEVVLARLNKSDSEMMPVIRYYKKRNIVHTVTVRNHEATWPLVKSFLHRRWRRYPVRFFRPKRFINLVEC